MEAQNKSYRQRLLEILRVFAKIGAMSYGASSNRYPEEMQSIDDRRATWTR